MATSCLPTTATTVTHSPLPTPPTPSSAAVGPHLDSHRRARVVLDASGLVREAASECADAFWPALGYLCGLKAEARVPALVGLEGLPTPPTRDDLKAFSAAFGTTGTAALFHMVGVTPEAPDLATALGDPAEGGLPCESWD